LNDFSDEALNRFDNETLHQLGRQGQTQTQQTQPQTVLNNFEEVPPIGNGTTSMQSPISRQQTPAELQTPWQQTPPESQTQRSPLNPASQETPQQVDFVQKPQPKDLLQPPCTESTSLQSSVQRGPPMSLRQAADIAQKQMGTGAATGGAETSSQEVRLV